MSEQGRVRDLRAITALLSKVLLESKEINRVTFLLPAESPINVSITHSYVSTHARRKLCFVKDYK